VTGGADHRRKRRKQYWRIFFFFREKETEEIRQMDDEEIIIAGGAHPRSLCWLASVRWKDTWRPGNQEDAGVAIPRGIGSIFL
jgi:hypothetical protein